MWTDLPITKRAPRFIFLFDGINILFLVIAVAKGARIASIVLVFAIFGTTLLYGASVRAARKNRPDLLKRYMNITVILSTIGVFLFLAGR